VLVWLGFLKWSPERGFERVVRGYRAIKSVDLSRKRKAFQDRDRNGRRLLGEETYRSALPLYDTCLSSWLLGHSSYLAANCGAMIYVVRYCRKKGQEWNSIIEYSPKKKSRRPCFVLDSKRIHLLLLKRIQQLDVKRTHLLVLRRTHLLDLKRTHPLDFKAKLFTELKANPFTGCKANPSPRRGEATSFSP
jgi:hypothetical protein